MLFLAVFIFLKYQLKRLVKITRCFTVSFRFSYFSLYVLVRQRNKDTFKKNVCLFVLLFCFCIIGESLVFQSSSMTVDVGTNVTLICDIESAFGQCSSVRWLLYQQETGLKIYISGIRTITRKAQQDTLCTMQISRIRPSNNGTYYCLLLNEGVDFMGNGTELTVMGKHP